MGWFEGWDGGVEWGRRGLCWVGEVEWGLVVGCEEEAGRGLGGFEGGFGGWGW